MTVRHNALVSCVLAQKLVCLSCGKAVLQCNSTLGESPCAGAATESIAKMAKLWGRHAMGNRAHLEEGAEGEGGGEPVGLVGQALSLCCAQDTAPHSQGCHIHLQPLPDLSEFCGPRYRCF